MEQDDTNFESVSQRLNEIAEKVSNKDISLDEALLLYEEAVNLGMVAIDLSSDVILEDETEEEVLVTEPTDSEEVA